MTPFLYQVARHYLPAGISEKCMVFPNRRSIVFFRKHLATLVAERGAGPLLMPRMLTVADFFSTLYGNPVSDKVSLLIELYDVYKDLYPNAESLDDFIFWGDVILSDFSDTDKYLVDPRQLFTNVADLKSIEDTYSYLSPAQRSAILRFLSHFKEISPLRPLASGRNDNTSSVNAGETSSVNASETSSVISSEQSESRNLTQAPIKARFLGLWNILLPLYEGFCSNLAAKGMAYDGMVYRTVADAFKAKPAADIVAAAFPGCTAFIFVGLNALNECELTVMSKLRDANLAEFCWDYSGEMIKDPDNRSSFFMAQNVERFPMSWALEDISAAPQVNVIGVPSAVGQAKLIPKLLGSENDTAVVLPDESLLMSVLNSIPDTVERVNVTMGLPVTGSRIHALMHGICQLQLNLRKSGGRSYFYHKYVWDILNGGIVKVLLTDEEKEKVTQVKAAAKYYIPEEDFACCGPLVKCIFRPVENDLAAYLEEVLRAVAPLMLEEESLATEPEFAKRWLDCLTRLKDKNLQIKPATFVRLLGQLLALQSVPLEGEPLGGLQIMGPLETRALDFGTVILLSCNEGIFPRHNVSASFIPPQLRKAFNLPTYEYQDSIWAYYFYRMICRAGRVWLLYDTRAEGGRSGEESRYIKQLQYHFGLPVRYYTSASEISFASCEPDIPKPADIEERLKATILSASALKAYMKCPARFYYATVLGLKKDEEVSESLDAAMFGDVYHGTMEDIYKRADWLLTVKFLDKWIKDKDGVRGIIAGKIKEKIHSVEVTGRNLVHEDIILEYVVKTLQIDRALVKERGDIRLLGLEKPFWWNWNGFKFYGRIDRLEQFKDGTVRVLDYKTGKVLDKDKEINLQLFLYDKFIEKDLPEGASVVNCIYPTQKLFKSGIHEELLTDDFKSGMEDFLAEKLAEIVNPSVPFTRTEDREHLCAYCDFKNICGR